MEASIRVSKQFSANILIDDRLLANKYELSYAISLLSSDPYEQRVAYDRIKFLTDNMFEGTVFIKYDNPLLKKLYRQGINNTYCQLHEEPYDSIIVDYVFLKAQSILEGRAQVDQLSVSSWQGKDIEFYSDAENDYSIYNKAPWIKGKNNNPWYLRSDILIGDYGKPTDIEIPDWDDLYLSWKSPPEEEAEVIQFNKFQGKVVKGGKSGD
jgi:hypothetical protein